MTTTLRYSRQCYIFPQLPVAAYTPMHQALCRILCHSDWGYGTVFSRRVWARSRAMAHIKARRLWADLEEPC